MSETKQAPTFDADAVRVAATALAASDLAFDNGVREVATALARIIGTDPTWDHWQAVKAAFCADYVEARQCKPETGAKRWSAVAARMSEEFALEAPTKPTPEAQRKAAAREAAGKAIEKILKSHKGDAAAILAAAQKAKPAEVAQYAKAAEIAAKAANKGATDAAREAEKALRAEAAAILKAAGGEALVRIVAAMRAAADATIKGRAKAAREAKKPAPATN